jgi:exonuclease SbcC
VDDRRARAVATLEYQGVAKTALEQGHCPLLEVECPVVAASPRTLDRFSEQMGALDATLRELDAQRADLDGRMATARKAGMELQSLQVQIARLETGQQELPHLAESLDACRAGYLELAKEVEGEADLLRAQRDVQVEITRLEAAAKLAATLPLLEEQQTHDVERLSAARQAAGELDERLAELTAVEREAEDLEKAVQALGDPRGRQTALLATAGRRSTLEASLRAEQDRLSRESDRLKILVAELQRYASLDEEIESRHRVEEEHAADWERYLQHEAEAGTLAERELAVTETSSKLEEARAAEAAAREELETVERTYVERRHAEISALSRELGEQMAAAGRTHQHLEGELRRAEEDLAYLQRKARQLERQREELAEVEATARAVGFVRETIKSAGPAVTESLLSNISQMANDIYAEIMDDHASELRWDRDYEILVQRGAETRGFTQLSGGEQMSAALAVRLALLKEMSEVDVAFFDEPTQNMDAERRGNLAGQIGQIRGFEQLIVISHDDTFEHHTDNLIRLRKVYDETQMESA